MDHRIDILSVFGLLSVLIGFIWWVFMTFYRKDEAIKLERQIRQEIQQIGADSKARNDKLEVRMEKIENSMSNVARDTSYIRGILESGCGVFKKQ